MARPSKRIPPFHPPPPFFFSPTPTPPPPRPAAPPPPPPPTPSLLPTPRPPDDPFARDRRRPLPRAASARNSISTFGKQEDRRRARGGTKSGSHLPSAPQSASSRPSPCRSPRGSA